MKSCPKCHTNLHDDAIRCQPCNYYFKEFSCNKCNKPLENETAICECGGRAKWINKPRVSKGTGNASDGLSLYWTRETLKNKAADRLVGKKIILAIIVCLLIASLPSFSVRIEEPKKYTPQWTVVTTSSGAGIVYDDVTWDATNNSEPIVKLMVVMGWLKITILEGPLSKLSYIVFWELAVLIFFEIFIKAPYSVGVKRYFMKDIYGETRISSVGYCFRYYFQIVYKMFLLSLILFLWYLLLIVPGIIKTYSYFMVPYILSENPKISLFEAMDISKSMMDGNKFDVFVLEFSFILWNILSFLTLGIADIVWVTPYKEATYAQLYDVYRSYYLRNDICTSDELIGYEN